jgi:hypothetical protein
MKKGKSAAKREPAKRPKLKPSDNTLDPYDFESAMRRIIGAPKKAPISKGKGE